MRLITVGAVAAVLANTPFAQQGPAVSSGSDISDHLTPIHDADGGNKWNPRHAVRFDVPYGRHHRELTGEPVDVDGRSD